MVDRYETIIGYRYEGQEQVQQYLSALDALVRRSSTLQQLARGGVAPNAFEEMGITPEQLNTIARGYDTVLQKQSALSRALNARTRVEERLTDPNAKKPITDETVRADMWRLANERVDRAAKSLADAMATEDKARRRAAAAAEAQTVAYANDRRATADAIVAARDRARTQIAENAKYDAFQVSYPDADTGTKLGQLQDDVNRAQRRLVTAQEAHAAVHNRAVKSAEERIRVDDQLKASERRLIEAQNRVAAHMQVQSAVAGASGGAGGGGLGSQFMTGFRGHSDRPYAEQLGQAFKFSIFYGTAYKLLFAFTATLQQTLQEGIEFEKAMTELKIASGASADAANDMAQSLSAQATAAGQAPSTGVMIGARSLGLFGATEAAGASPAEQQRIMDISSRVVSRMALGSKLPIEELQTQIAAVANAFGGGAAGQIRAYDLDAYLGRQFGVMQGQVLQAVAEAANVGQAAGFDQEQVSAIAAAMISRTGQSPSTAAGWMAQIFSRGGEGSLTAVTQRYGIDPNAELSTQIAELARIYKSASSTEQAAILASFGRGKVQNAAEVLLGSFDEIIKAADRSRTEAAGEGDRISDLRLRDIGGQIQLTVAAMQAFASQLGRSGVLDIVGAGVVAFRELVEAVTGLLSAWNELPGAVRAAVISLGLLAVAGRTGAIGAAGGLMRGAAMGGTLRGTGGVAGGLASAGPWIAAAAGLYALGELVSSTKRLKDAQETATEALNAAPLGVGATADDFRARAAELTQSATIAREDAGSSWMNRVLPSSRRAAAELREDADSMDAESRRMAANAKIIENAAADMAGGTEKLITGFDRESLASSMEILTNRGASASERMSALADAITGAGDAATSTAAKYDPKLFAAQNVDPLTAILGENITGIDGKKMTPEAVREALGGLAGTPETGIMRALAGAGIGGFGDFDITGATKAARELVARAEGGHADYKGTEEYKNAVETVRDFLLEQTRQGRLLVDAAVRLTPEEGMNDINTFIAEASNLDATTQETDFRGRIRNARRLARNIQRTINRTDDPGQEMFIQLDVARRELAQRQFEELEHLRRAAQRNARSRAEVARIGQRFLRRELRAAIRGGNQDLLATIIGQAGASAVKIAEAIIREAINAARAARAAYLQILAVQRAAQSALGAEIEFVRGGLSQMPSLNTEAQQMLQNLPSMQTAGSWEDNVYASGSDVPGFEPPKEGKSPKDRSAEREAARQEMLDLKNNLYLLSIDLSDPLALATAAVKDARRRLQSDIASGQDRGTVAASRVALRQAEIEREATAFQQRLEAMQTAEELGRISHRKYISYLESERKRLGAIKDRTYQQQQQLDEIDRLMKDAAEQMQGQWNFGDIKLPTPYQVRRQVEQMRLDRATQLDATSGRVASSVTTINIDGADVGKVRQIITETLGRSNQTVTTRPRRR